MGVRFTAMASLHQRMLRDYCRRVRRQRSGLWPELRFAVRHTRGPKGLPGRAGNGHGQRRKRSGAAQDSSVVDLWPALAHGPRDAIRYFNLIRQVAARYRVLLFAMLESPDEARHVAKLAPFCERVEWASCVPAPRSSAHAIFAGHCCRVRPLVTWPYSSRSLETKLRDLGQHRHGHILQIEHSSWRTSAMRFPRARAVGRSSRSTTSARRSTAPCCACIRVWWRSWLAGQGILMRGWEARHAPRFDRCLVVSEIEAQRLRAVAAAPRCRSSPTAWIPRLCARCPRPPPASG